jgi:zinc finger protein-like protein
MVGFDCSSVAGLSSFAVVSEPDSNEVDEDDEGDEDDELQGTGQADVSEAESGLNDRSIDGEGEQAEDRLEGSDDDASVRRLFRDRPHEEATAELQRRTSTQIEAGEELIRQDACSELRRCQFDMSFTDDSETVLGCIHYHRKVKLFAACCNVFVTCRLCHDDLMNGSHFMERRKVEKVLCMVCKQVQDVGQKCVNPACEVEEFATYFCAICRLYDSSGTPVYHCDSCGLCRKGVREENFHCSTCNACVSLESQLRHRCMPRSLDVDCPICKEYLFTSRKPVVYMRCGHTMHSECWDVYTRTKYTCPLCQKCLTTMDSYYRELDNLMLVELANMPPEFRNRKNRIFCNDCERTSEAPFHFEFHRCGVTLKNGQPCGSYNTRVL